MTSQRSAHAINSKNHIAGYVVLPAIAKVLVMKLGSAYTAIYVLYIGIMQVRDFLPQNITSKPA